MAYGCAVFEQWWNTGRLGISLAEIGDFPNCGVAPNVYIYECNRLLWGLEHIQGLFPGLAEVRAQGLGFRPYTLLLYRAAGGIPTGLSEEITEELRPHDLGSEACPLRQSPQAATKSA